MENREKFSSRIGFLLISAGCAIGLGNVWRFPFITGQYGGAAFVLIYLFFLCILGLPIMVMEYAVGRASQKSIAKSFQVLEPAGSKWHWYSYIGMAGNYLLKIRQEYAELEKENRFLKKSHGILCEGNRSFRSGNAVYI